MFFVYQTQDINTIPEIGKRFKAGENTLVFGIVIGVEGESLEKAKVSFFRKFYTES